MKKLIPTNQLTQETDCVLDENAALTVAHLQWLIDNMRLMASRSPNKADEYNFNIRMLSTAIEVVKKIRS